MPHKGLKTMNFDSIRLHHHLENSLTVEHLSNLATDVGFIKVDEKLIDREHTVYALKASGLKNLVDLDDFIKKNLERIEPFFADLVKRNTAPWTATNAFFYQLIVLLKVPAIFNDQFKADTEWDDRIAKIVQETLDNHSEKMVKQFIF